MQDDESVSHGFVSPWFIDRADEPIKLSNEVTKTDYFPNDFPIDDALVLPAHATSNEKKAA
jgi:hypothetical protein